MMREIVDLLKYCFKTRRAWWFTAVSKTKATETPTEKKVWKWSEIQKMKPDEYSRYEEQIDKAHREGRIQ